MIPDPDAAKTVLVAGTYDTKGEELAYLSAFCAAMERMVPDNTTLHRLECHINDAGFTGKVLEIFDDWLAQGIVRR